MSIVLQERERIHEASTDEEQTLGKREPGSGYWTSGDHNKCLTKALFDVFVLSIPTRIKNIHDMCYTYNDIGIELI